MRRRRSPFDPLLPNPHYLRVLTPFRNFAHTTVSGGIVLFVAAVIAIIWANSPWADSYDRIFHAYASVTVAGRSMELSLAHWINDGLMVIFFFVVGLEIKREFVLGELATLRQALLPIAAAAGGAIVPAGIYLAATWGTDMSHGWGIPMATDIAFALGVLTLLGSRVPIGLKVFLTALAIVDDILAVLVIALFYTEQVGWDWLALGIGLVGVLFLARAVGVRAVAPYVAIGLIVWFAFVQSGVHATVAGVLLALVIPSRTRINADEFLDRAHRILDDFRDAGAEDKHVLTNAVQASALQDLETATENIQAPSQVLEHNLHPWVAFVILPIFALANAGVAIGDTLDDALTSPITLGIVAGLFFGKQVGITLTTWICVRAGISTLPAGVTWRHIYGAACLAGIGFTMSLFIADLAFTDALHLDIAKVGILVASLLAGVVGFALLRLATRPQKELV